MERNKVVIIQRIFPFYRKFIFDDISKEFDLKLLHSDLDLSIKNVKANYSFPLTSFKYGKSETNVWILVFFKLFKIKPDIVIHEFNVGLPSLYFSFFYSKIFKIPFILWGHGINRFRGLNGKNSFIDKLKIYFAKSSSSLLLYTEGAKKDFQLLGVKNIYVAQNTIDSKSIVFDSEIILKKYDLMINSESPVFKLLYVGRIVKEKSPFDFLFIVEDLLHKGFTKFKIFIVGDGNLLDELKAEVVSKNLSEYFQFFGKITDEVFLKPIFEESNVFINPGYVGLSINHSFFYGLPLITLKNKGNGPFHSPEIDYLIDGYNGFMVDSISDFSDCIIQLYNSPSLLKESSINAFEYSQKYLKSEYMISNISKMIYQSLK